MIRSKILAVLSVAVMLLALPAATQAQVSQTNVVSVTIPEILRLSVDATTDFGTLDDAVFDDGVTTEVDVAPPTAPAVTISSNRDWSLGVRGATTMWQIGGVDGTKDAADLFVGVSPATGFTATAGAGSEISMPGANTEIANGVRGQHSGSISYVLKYRLSDEPGTYSLDVIYTLTGS